MLGDETYESLSRTGQHMTTAAMVSYVYDQLDQARAELANAPRRQRGRPSDRVWPR